MALRSRIGGVFIGLSVVGAMGILPSLAQEPAASAKQEKGASSSKGYRRTPPYFSKVGLTTEQKEKVYAIRGKYQEEIGALKAKIEELQAKELTECEGVLLDSQKKVLAELRAAAKQTKKAADAEKKSQD